MSKIYPTDLTHTQWNTIIHLFDENRRRIHSSLYSIWNAIFYLLKTGCQGHMLPKEYPKWELVYYYYSKWRDDETFEEVHENLCNHTRKRAGKQVSPSLAIIDSQSWNMTRRGGTHKGFDGGKT